MKALTVVLTNFARARNVHTIIARLRAQTEHVDIFLWDNSRDRMDDFAVDWYIQSSVNQYCWPRWFMAASAQTEFVMTLDDDLCFIDPKGVGVLVSALCSIEREDQAIGPGGVILLPDEPYLPPPGLSLEQRSRGLRGSTHVRNPTADTPVDIVKGRAFACRTLALRNLPMHVPYGDRCDDIAVSALLAKNRPRWHLVPSLLTGVFENLPESQGPMALSTAPDWDVVRERGRRSFFSR